MDYKDLIINLSEIPTKREDIAENLEQLRQHAEYLGSRDDVSDPRASGILQTAPAYIQKQVERLQRHLDGEADLIAWISRSLMELLFVLRYMYNSPDRYDEVIQEQLKDLRDIEEIIYSGEESSEEDPEDIKFFRKDMKKLWERIEAFGIKRDDLNGPTRAYQYAKDTQLEDEYRQHWKIHSKYIHPTPYLLFGRRSFVYGDGAGLYFWVLAQYYAARNLRDIHRMVESIP